MAQIAVLDVTVTASTANEAHPHGLERVPDRVFLVKREDKPFARVTGDVTAATPNEAHAHGLGVIPDIIILEHSTSDLVAIGATPADDTSIYLTNTSIHDKPFVAFVGVEEQVTIGATASTDTNIYLTNAKAEDQDVRVVVSADHSLIA